MTVPVGAQEAAFQLAAEWTVTGHGTSRILARSDSKAIGVEQGGMPLTGAKDA